MLFDSIQKIFDLYPCLSLIWLVFDERVFEEIVGVGTLVVVLHQHRFDKVLELGAPPLGL